MASTSPNAAGVMLAPKGRGRGRGIMQAKPAAQQQTKEKTLKEYLRELQQGSMKSTFDFVTRPSPRGQEVLDETAAEICSRVLQDVEFVETAAEFLKMLWDASLYENVSIRKPLLIQIQKIYQGRDKLTDFELQSYVAFMCDLFGSLLINGEPLNVLIGPIYSILRDLLKKNVTPDMQNILTFHMVMSKHGSLLQKQNKVYFLAYHRRITLIHLQSCLGS